jgi:hypothetical protein
MSIFREFKLCLKTSRGNKSIYESFSRASLYPSCYLSSTQCQCTFELAAPTDKIPVSQLFDRPDNTAWRAPNSTRVPLLMRRLVKSEISGIRKCPQGSEVKPNSERRQRWGVFLYAFAIRRVAIGRVQLEFMAPSLSKQYTRGPGPLHPSEK